MFITRSPHLLCPISVAAMPPCSQWRAQSELLLPLPVPSQAATSSAQTLPSPICPRAISYAAPYPGRRRSCPWTTVAVDDAITQPMFSYAIQKRRRNRAEPRRNPRFHFAPHHRNLSTPPKPRHRRICPCPLPPTQCSLPPQLVISTLPRPPLSYKPSHRASLSSPSTVNLSWSHGLSILHVCSGK
ncbi:hypothetical protein M0R45_006664 [Rubus argutus]|uniref:Uncharacterized protein n=1 Tax=Rubus argutus TaxID=59490 RepID=A0AAW1YRA9_RUBAR